MNAPERWELFRLPEGARKITLNRDTRLPHAATFTILKEDHTLGNLLRHQLLKDKRVIFAGYRVPHPLEHTVELRVQTTDESTPIQVLQEAVQELIANLGTLK